MTIDSNGCFDIDGIRFVIDVPPTRPSTSESFSIAKSEPYIRFYEELAEEFSPEGVLELGIFQGGSYAFIDKLFSPAYMSAVDLSEDAVGPLEDYIAGRPGRYAHFFTSQTDEATLGRIVDEELDEKLDLVVDDASHLYEPTKRSFEILFPRLRGGGLYVVEDWSWAHDRDHQDDRSPYWREPALTNLLLEQVLMTGSTWSIAEIRILRFLYVIRKAGDLPELSADTVWQGLLNRGRELPRI